MIVFRHRTGSPWRTCRKIPG